MAAITIQFSQPTDDSSLALIPVDVSDDRGRIIHRQAVPLSTNAALAYDFEPGSYLVRGTLPSGEIAACTVDLSKASSAVAVLRSPTRSPRETLSWAYFLQPALRSTTTAGQSSILGVVDGSLASSRVPITPLTSFWQHSSLGWSGLPVSQGVPRQGFFTHVNFEPSEGTLFIELKSDVAWQHNLGQFWIQVVSEIHSQFVAVPPTHTMRIFIAKQAPTNAFDPPFQVIVGSGDPAMQSLVGFLASGDFESARSVGDHWLTIAEKMLQEKLTDAVAAAVAGYFLLRVGDHSRLHDWTRNLADWNPWLPDGPVIRAFHILSTDTPDLKEVRQRLLQAAERGVPLYTQGLRMLFDGLNMMNARANGNDPALLQALETIRSYATTARWRSPVTSFAAVEPSHPELPEVIVSRDAPSGYAVGARSSRANKALARRQ